MIRDANGFIVGKVGYIGETKILLAIYRMADRLTRIKIHFRTGIYEPMTEEEKLQFPAIHESQPLAEPRNRRRGRRPTT